MKFFGFAFALLLFSACSPGKFATLKNKYPEEPFIIKSEKSKDQVWDNLIDFFAQNGIRISIIDRSSGLLITNEKTPLTVTTEDKTGKIISENAYVVAPRYYDPNQKKWYSPVTASGEWNVRIKADGAGSVININLLNVRAGYKQTTVRPVNYKEIESEFTGKGYTTHKFEAVIANFINK